MQKESHFDMLSRLFEREAGPKSSAEGTRAVSASPLRVAAVCPRDEASASALLRAMDCGAVRLSIFGCGAEDERPFAEHIADGRAEAFRAASEAAAAREAVGAAREGRVDVVMKGLVNTADLLRAALDKECGLVPAGSLMSHVAAFDVEQLGRLVLATDVAIIPRPTLEQMHSMLANVAAMARRMGNPLPHIALIHCNEKASDKFPHTLHYAELKRRATRGDYGEAVVDGPMDVKVALDGCSALTKGICSPVAGCADVLLFPNIEAGNTFYKTVTLLTHTTTAGIVCGTTAPIALPSRADNARSKYFSLVLACMMANKNIAQNV